MIHDHQPPRIEPSTRAGIFLLVVLLHLLLLYWLAMIRAAPLPDAPLFPPFEVQLFPPGGGGSPARDAEASPTPPEVSSAPSAVHVPPVTAPWPDTVPAPPEPAPQDTAIGFGATADDILALSVETTRTANDAQEGVGDAEGGLGGGQGGGAGSGQGSGDGAGRGGRGSGAVLIRGPAGASISQNVSPQALAALPGSYAVLRCQIRLTQRLEQCRVRREYPQGSGVGQAALARAAEFRFRPPRTGSRFRDRHRITIAIAFPPEAEEAPEP